METHAPEQPHHPAPEVDQPPDPQLAAMLDCLQQFVAAVAHQADPDRKLACGAIWAQLSLLRQTEDLNQKKGGRRIPVLTDLLPTYSRAVHGQMKKLVDAILATVATFDADHRRGACEVITSQLRLILATYEKKRGANGVPAGVC